MKTLYIISNKKNLHRYDKKNNILSLVTRLEGASTNAIKEAENYLLKERGLKKEDYKIQVI